MCSLNGQPPKYPHEALWYELESHRSRERLPTCHQASTLPVYMIQVMINIRRRFKRTTNITSRTHYIPNHYHYHLPQRQTSSSRPWNPSPRTSLYQTSLTTTDAVTARTAHHPDSNTPSLRGTPPPTKQLPSRPAPFTTTQTAQEPLPTPPAAPASQSRSRTSAPSRASHAAFNAATLSTRPLKPATMPTRETTIAASATAADKKDPPPNHPGTPATPPPSRLALRHPTRDVRALPRRGRPHRAIQNPAPINELHQET